MVVQEDITNQVTWIGGAAYPGVQNSGWVPSTRPGPTATNSAGQFIDSPFGGCSSLPAIDTNGQEYRVQDNGVWFNLNPVLNVSIFLGLGTETVTTQSYSFTVGR